ncbi:MAG: hypothetical protein H0V82_01590 [Candidatus Protochlamydia sp.]|nr:hypothetical protein [Candidatus Protochlamydia sp.]
MQINYIKEQIEFTQNNNDITAKYINYNEQGKQKNVVIINNSNEIFLIVNKIFKQFASTTFSIYFLSSNVFNIEYPLNKNDVHKMKVDETNEKQYSKFKKIFEEVFKIIDYKEQPPDLFSKSKKSEIISDKSKNNSLNPNDESRKRKNSNSSEYKIENWLSDLKEKNLHEDIIINIKNTFSEHLSVKLGGQALQRLNDYIDPLSKIDISIKDKIVEILKRHPLTISKSFNDSCLKFYLLNKDSDVKNIIFAYNLSRNSQKQRQDLNCLEFFSSKFLDEKMFELVKSCVENNINGTQKITDALPLLELAINTGKDVKWVIYALEKNSVESVKGWVKLTYSKQEIGELIDNNPSIAKKHLAVDWPAAKKVINKRHENDVSKATCLFGVGAKEKLIEEVCKLMNSFSAKIGADLFGNEPKGEIKINEPISSGIKFNVAYIGDRGVQFNKWEKIEFVLINENGNMVMVHCVALQ